MTRRACAIILLAAVMLQAILGGLGTVATFCLGGGHHEHAQVQLDHHGPCDHHHDDLALVDADHDHGHDCGCIDIDLALTELVSTRGRDTAPAIAPAGNEPSTLHAYDTRAPDRPMPRLADEDPGGRQRLAVVSSTRLLI
ncbi:MAG: hypothetical protein KDA20_12055 [Phycisphaerales bacterium]|nr:hypothetical protein [Phycisphaerales bacterium]